MRTARPARAGSSNHLYERRLTYATGGGDDDAGITVGCSVQSSGDAVIGLMIGLMIGHGAQPSHPANEKISSGRKMHNIPRDGSLTEFVPPQGMSVADDLTNRLPEISNEPRTRAVARRPNAPMEI